MVDLPFWFTDAAGRTWRVVLTCGSVIECERQLDVKLLDLCDPQSDESLRLGDVERIEALVFVLQSEIRRHAITESDLLKALPKAANIKAAWEAFYGAILRFLPGGAVRSSTAETATESPKPSVHDSIVGQIWELAAWAGVEPWRYTFAELERQATATASVEGRVKLAEATGQAPPIPAVEETRPLSERYSMEDLARRTWRA